MKVNLKCFSSLSNSDGCDFRDSTTYELADGQTVEDLIQSAGLSKGEIKITFVNSRKSDFETVLSHGDKVGLAPAVGGM